jgi:hypothetical protein
VVAGLAGAALIGPGAGSVGAAGPGSDDNLPNSGHTSSNGLTLLMSKNDTMACDANNSVGSISGTFTFSGSGHVVIYLTPNTGSDADPVGNVENNETTIDLTGKTSPVAFKLTVNSPFTTSKGGVLAVFARAEDGTIYNSKSNSLNCTETTTTTTSSESSTSTVESSTSTVESSTSTVESSTSTVESTTSTVESSTSVASTTSESSGEVEGVQGTPNVTLPPTSTLDAATTTGSPDGLRIVLLALAVLLASILLLQPRGSRSRK